MDFHIPIKTIFFLFSIFLFVLSVIVFHKAYNLKGQRFVTTILFCFGCIYLFEVVIYLLPIEYTYFVQVWIVQTLSLLGLSLIAHYLYFLIKKHTILNIQFTPYIFYLYVFLYVLVVGPLEFFYGETTYTKHKGWHIKEELSPSIFFYVVIPVLISKILYLLAKGLKYAPSDRRKRLYKSYLFGGIGTILISFVSIGLMRGDTFPPDIAILISLPSEKLQNKDEKVLTNGQSEDEGDMGNFHLNLPKQLESYRTTFEKTMRPYVKIETKKGKTLPWESKFGGNPYIPKDFKYPKDADGNPMYLLAQINFEEVPHIEPFPTKGILQFYIAADDVYYSYGLDFDNPTSQDYFRVIYFPEVIKDEKKLQTDFGFLPELEENVLPVNGEFTLSFSKGYQPVTADDFQFAQFFGKDAYELAKSVFKNEKDLEKFFEDYQFFGHQIGGYAHFTQVDPREYKEQFQDHKILLLQIDSFNEEDIMWGDVGVGNFFIREQDLKKLDFSNILYNWDST